MGSSAVDFVVTWVDGSDECWLSQRRKYARENSSGDNREERYRDLGLLKYWFRGIERFAPWVNQIHFVTWGHVPLWLNTAHEKISIVNHQDYVPAEYLPTFNSNVLDLNCFRIEGLAERFVLFNDDTFLISQAEPELFFVDGLPRSSAVLSPMRVVKGTNFYTPFANVAILNEHFDLWTCVKNNPGKWLNTKYGVENLRTLAMLPFRSFYGFKENHLPNAFLKSTFKTVWELEGDSLHQTCMNQFRGIADVSQWLMRQWQVASGGFCPQELSVGHNYELSHNYEDTLLQACRDITASASPMVCISDGGLDDIQFAVAKEVLADVFAGLLPEKSGFEL